MTEFALRIVGAGAIGSLLAAGAEQAGVKYSLTPRKAAFPAVQVVKLNGERICLRQEAFEGTLTDRHLLVLPLKAYQLADAACMWRPRILPSTPVLLLHNGMGGYETVRQHMPDNPLLLATTSQAALRISPTEVKHTGQGHTDIGPAPDTVLSDATTAAIYNTLCACFSPLTWRNDMLLALWTKLTVNAVINPLTAIHDVTNGELVKPKFATIIADVINEIAQVMRSSGHDIAEDVLREQVYQVIRSSASNYSSMHQDIKYRRRTEIDAINGYVVRVAQKKGIDVPTNTFLFNKVTMLQTND